MSVGLAGVDDIVEQPLAEYLWSDLRARRTALSLWPEDLAPLLGLNLTRYRSYETGGRDRPGPGLVNELIAMEAFVAGETDRLIEGAPAEGTVVLHAVVDQPTFNVRYPQACTRRHQNRYPVSLQYVAVGRAVAELSRRGRDVEVYRGERHFDLTAGRLAVGLGKNETARLLGLNEKSYYAAERGSKPPREATLGELQDLDEFIVDTANRLEISVEDGVSVIWIHSDQAEFEKAYPEARVQRSDTPYPARMLCVAAGRQAGALEAAGRSVRIAVID